LNEIHQKKDRFQFSTFCGKLWQNSLLYLYFNLFFQI
jgi:hypothetical protein